MTTSGFQTDFDIAYPVDAAAAGFVAAVGTHGGFAEIVVAVDTAAVDPVVLETAAIVVVAAVADYVALETAAIAVAAVYIVALETATLAVAAVVDFAAVVAPIAEVVAADSCIVILDFAILVVAAAAEQHFEKRDAILVAAVANIAAHASLVVIIVAFEAFAADFAADVLHMGLGILSRCH